MNNITQELICDKLFSMVGRPKNTVMCKAINLYDNRYRINVYTEHESENLTYRRISYSCFAKIHDKEIEIIDQTPNYSVPV